ncbi:DUF3772 domain-containing protein [Methylonatrum kenyense]|uniref:DUF3772 domain-containing protein n=1 Tax=Methylonatrum kenyense TaxID=455253 RepID=UPI0020BED3ED|nr:DUF3772 domain-containing protein [Methylonatrum kenyense]MCK8515205.1 DUF3772 domain-containing protein [Methylonatrum kenyense]
MFSICSFRFLTVILLILGVTLGASPKAMADEALSVDQRLHLWERTLNEAEAALEADFEQADMREIRQDLQGVLDEARQERSRARSRAEASQRQLDQLGEAPAEDEPEEDAALSRMRDDLKRSASTYTGQVTRIELVVRRAADLLEDIAWWEQRRFRQQILYRVPTPLSPDIWPAAGSSGAELGLIVLRSPVEWWEEQRQDEHDTVALVLLLSMPIIGLLLGWPIRRWLIRHLGRDPEELQPSYARRILAAVGDGLANAVVPAAIIGLVIASLWTQDVLTGLFGHLLIVVGGAVAGYLMLVGLSRAALSPYLVAWRILPVEPAYANQLLFAIRATFAVVTVAVATLLLSLEVGVHSDELEAAFFLIQTSLVAGLSWWMLSPRYWIDSVAASQAGGSVSEADAPVDGEVPSGEPVSDEGDSPHLLDRGRALVRVALVLAPVLALAGFGRLGYFLQTRLLATMALVGLGILLFAAVREGLERLYRSGYSPFHGRREAGSPPPSEQSVRALVFWSSLLTNVLILIPLLYIALLLYGVPPIALAIWTRDFLSGVQIAGVTLSPANLILAVGLLLATVFVTNLIRRWLNHQVLPNTRLDDGARNSISAATGYLGVGIGILLALSVMGLDFTNLALVAGALSLGIGFGLRNVVENFAAGLLLLIERPIKVGDWIIVGSNEGTVRHISVRSTEIETFNRASVIVPNSELISTAVTNWTHKNRMAREILKVGVAYGSDTRQVARILARCAEQHPRVLKVPPPVVYFLGFGDSALEFELRCFIGDTDDFVVVLSDLHFAVDQAFREAGIKIPFPQRDLHLRHTDAVPDDAAALENEDLSSVHKDGRPQG